MLVGGDSQVAQGLLVAVLDPGAAHHPRPHEPGAVASALGAKCLPATPRHGREDEPCRHLDRADIPALAEVDHGRRMVLGSRLTGVEPASYHSRPSSGPRAPHSRLWRRFVKDVILTPEGYKQLTAELNVLRTTKRREI